MCIRDRPDLVTNNFYTPNKFHLGDIANLFLQALEKLNIKKLHAITGGSIGGCLTWEIAAKKPDIAKFIIPVASDWKARDWMIANTYLQDRILNNSRHPVQDARIHAMTFYRSPESFSKRFDRTFNESKGIYNVCLLYTSPSPRDRTRSRMPSSA